MLRPRPKRWPPRPALTSVCAHHTRRSHSMSEARTRHAGWRVVIACFAMTFFGFGFGFYGHSVYLAALTIRDGTDVPGIAVSTVSAAGTAYFLPAAATNVLIS